MKAIHRWTVASYLCCASIVALLESCQRHGELLVGNNEAGWARITLDCLPQTLPSLSNNLPYPFNFDITSWTRCLPEWHGVNSRIVRIWVFTGLQGIVLGPSDSNPQDTGVDALRGHLKLFLSRPERHGLKVHVTVLNAGDMKAAVDNNNSDLQGYF